jgi:hypothetical protein
LEKSKGFLKEKEGIFIDYEMFVDMKKALRETFASGAYVIIAIMAKRCGRNVFEKIKKKAKTKKDALEQLCNMVNERNWGELSFTEVNFEKKSGKGIIKNSFEARNCKSTTPCCHFLSNFIAGFLSKAFEKEINVVELKCAGKGDTYCEFKF